MVAAWAEDFAHVGAGTLVVLGVLAGPFIGAAVAKLALGLAMLGVFAAARFL